MSGTIDVPISTMARARNINMTYFVMEILETECTEIIADVQRVYVGEAV